MLLRHKRIEFEDETKRAKMLARGWREVEILEHWRGRMEREDYQWSRAVRLMPPGHFHPRNWASVFAHDRLHVDNVEGADEIKATWLRQAAHNYRNKVFEFIIPQSDCVEQAGFLIVSQQGIDHRIEFIAVRDEHQKKGVAQTMVRNACMAMHIRRLYAGTQQHNEPAKALYRSLGMEVVRRQRTFHR